MPYQGEVRTKIGRMILIEFKPKLSMTKDDI